MTTPHQAYQPGGFWRRVLASIIDGLILGFVQYPINLAYQFVANSFFAHTFQSLMEGIQQGVTPANVYSPEVLGPVILSFFFQTLMGVVVAFFWFGWFYKNKGGTPGKLVLGLRVVDSSTGAHLGYGRTFIREIVWKQWAPMLLMMVMACTGVAILVVGLPDFESRSPDFAKLGFLILAILGSGFCFLMCYVVAAFRTDKKAVHDLIFGTRLAFLPGGAQARGARLRAESSRAHFGL
jgi:uncharacterized RDD family membrane protein YckC